jgi:lactoylglutathione lyase
MEHGGPRIATVRIEHVGLYVRDLERMRAFYVEWLGGRSGPLYRNPTSGFRSHFVTFASGARIELMSRGDETGRPHASSEHSGLAHVALTVGDREAVDALVAELAEHEVEVASRPRMTGDGYYEAVVLDPEGNRIEIMAERSLPSGVAVL